MPASSPRDRFRFATEGERELLEQLQRRSALASGDYREQILAHPDAIAIPEEHISGKRIRVAQREEKIVGFYVLLAEGNRSLELDGLFVEPELFGAGIGRALILDAFASATQEGRSRIEVTANPRAIGFYERLGFLGIGVVQTRFAPGLRMGASLPITPPSRDLTSEHFLLKRVDLRDFERCRADPDKLMQSWNVRRSTDFEHWLQPPERDAMVAIEWDSFWIIERASRVFMGAFGCRKFPNAEGEIEIAYGIAPSFQNKGFATQIVRAVMPHLSKRGDIRSVIAFTLPQENASTRVLTKCAFVRAGTAVDPDEGEVWRWRYLRNPAEECGEDRMGGIVVDAS